MHLSRECRRTHRCNSTSTEVLKNLCGSVWYLYCSVASFELPILTIYIPYRLS
ncbi:hypothetical protein BDN70DRAFT_885433 [Pholiota conissans]|uniref:Uncharacterized protein n=1 Tax=Pholiota conissans TaxID=109636 RepID=A0A9P5YU94_9AGAR|nr:hypothetical protein BDN70DRAFT_885433 [Pholiota conissans]